MRAPQSFGLEDLVDLAAYAGLRLDRRAAGRTLRMTPIRGVAAPTKRGEPWRVPRRCVVDAVAALLRARDMRELARLGFPQPPLDAYRYKAALALLNADHLADLVPPKLAREAIQRRQAEAERRRRAELERQREERRRVEAIVARERERRERERAAEREWAERRAREERKRRVDRAYGVARRIAYLDLAEHCAARGIDGPTGRDWPQRHAYFVEACPIYTPAWWSPPDEFVALVHERGCDSPRDLEEAEQWRRWVSRYEPGKPWPVLQWGREKAGVADQDDEDEAAA